MRISTSGDQPSLANTSNRTTPGHQTDRAWSLTTSNPVTTRARQSSLCLREDRMSDARLPTARCRPCFEVLHRLQGRATLCCARPLAGPYPSSRSASLSIFILNCIKACCVASSISLRRVCRAWPANRACQERDWAACSLQACEGGLLRSQPTCVRVRRRVRPGSARCREAEVASAYSRSSHRAARLRTARLPAVVRGRPGRSGR